MHIRNILTIAALAIILSASLATAGDVHPFAGIGVVANGDYTGLSSTSRLTYNGGVEIGITDLIGIGPEVLYQRVSDTETIGGVTATATGNLIVVTADVFIHPPVESAVAPYVGIGLGEAHVSISGHADVFGVPVFEVHGSDNSFCVSGFGGIIFGRHFYAGIKAQHAFSTTDAIANFGVRF